MWRDELLHIAAELSRDRARCTHARGIDLRTRPSVRRGKQDAYGNHAAHHLELPSESEGHTAVGSSRSTSQTRSWKRRAQSPAAKEATHPKDLWHDNTHQDGRLKLGANMRVPSYSVTEQSTEEEHLRLQSFHGWPDTKSQDISTYGKQEISTHGKGGEVDTSIEASHELTMLAQMQPWGRIEPWALQALEWQMMRAGSKHSWMSKEDIELQVHKQVEEARRKAHDAERKAAEESTRMKKVTLLENIGEVLVGDESRGPIAEVLGKGVPHTATPNYPQGKKAKNTIEEMVKNLLASPKPNEDRGSDEEEHKSLKDPPHERASLKKKITSLRELKEDLPKETLTQAPMQRDTKASHAKETRRQTAIQQKASEMTEPEEQVSLCDADVYGAMNLAQLRRQVTQRAARCAQAEQVAAAVLDSALDKCRSPLQWQKFGHEVSRSTEGRRLEHG